MTLNWDFLGVIYTQLKRGNIAIDFETNEQPGQLTIMFI